MTALIVVAAVVFLGCALIFIAAEGKIRGQEAKRESMEKQVDSSRQMAQKLEQTRLTYLDTCSQIRYLESSVTTQAYVPTLLQQLEALGRSVNLKVLGVRPQPKEVTPPKTPASGEAKASESNAESGSQTKAGEASGKKAAGPYDELKIDVEVEGNFNNALDFLYKLTSFPKIVAVNSVQMAPVSSTKIIGSPKLTVSSTSPHSCSRSPHPMPCRITC